MEVERHLKYAVLSCGSLWWVYASGWEISPYCAVFSLSLTTRNNKDENTHAQTVSSWH